MQKRRLEMSAKVLDCCRNKFSRIDSCLDVNVDEVFTCFHRTQLHMAAMSDNIKLAKKLLYWKHDLSSKKDSRGWTPLHLASARASLEMVELLLTAEPKACEAKDEAQRTPLHLAVMNNRVEIMELLMEKGLPQAVLLKNNQNAETILHFCVKSNCSIETLALLVDKLALTLTSDPKTIINSKDSKGKTVLQLAAERRKTEMMQYLLESGKLKQEITNAEFDQAFSALPPKNKKDLETRLLKNHGHGNNKRGSKTLPKNGDDHEGLKERLSSLMVVATLIAGIAFQAAMNPPGGVWQDDSKVDSGTEPVKFAYYLDHMFGNSTFGSYISGGLDRYIKEILTNIVTTTRQYDIISGFTESLMNMKNTDYFNQTVRGLILSDSDFTDIVSNYNNSTDGGKSFHIPYLIRYAGYPILAYTYPANYVVYMVTNGVALLTSLAIITLVACGFMVETTVYQVRVLVVLMCISIACIALSYMSILQAMLPDFYVEARITFIVLQLFFGVCCILGVGLFILTLVRKIVKLRKRRWRSHNYLEALFFSMDAKAAGELMLFTVGYFGLRLNGYIYYGSWSNFNRFLLQTKLSVFATPHE